MKRGEFYRGRYKGSLSTEVCDMLEVLLEVDSVPDLKHCIYDLPRDTVDYIKEQYEYTGEVPTDYEKPVGTLRKDQDIGVAFLYWAESAILADSVGIGKSVQVAGLVNLLSREYNSRGKDFNYLFLTEKTPVSEMRDKMIQFTGTYVEELYGEKRFVTKFIKNYEDGCPFGVVGAHSLIQNGLFLEWLYSQPEFPFDLIVVDESSILGNSATKIYKDASILLENVSRRVFLNATPFEKTLMSYYNQLRLIDKYMLPTKKDFNKDYVIMNYAGGYPKPSGEYKNWETFRYLVGYRCLARTRLKSGAEISNCRGELLIAELTDMQKRLLKRTYLKQLVYDCPTYFEADLPFNVENVPKLGLLLDILQNKLETTTIIIYAHYKEVQHHLQRWLDVMGYTSAVLNGDISSRMERNNIIKDFRNGEFDILITNVQKSLDFDFCDNLIFYGFNPNPQKMVQMEGRMTRSFDIKNKNVFLLCTKGDELRYLKRVVKQRADGSSQFTDTDFSLILDLLSKLKGVDWREGLVVETDA